jgi:hypothetical protein
MKNLQLAPLLSPVGLKQVFPPEKPNQEQAAYQGDQ